MTSDSVVKRQYAAGRNDWRRLFRKAARRIRMLLLSLPALLLVLLMRLLRPWLVIRIYPLTSCRLGHFGTNTELYLCERDAGINVPGRRYVDLCCDGCTPIANQQLATMWRRRMTFWPAWLLVPAYRLNKRLPGARIHEAGHTTQRDRDVHNLLERTPPHLSFTAEEERRGKAALASMGIADGAEFVCLVGRDDAYLKPLASVLAPSANFNYHSYRDVDIQNFVAAAEALAGLGYYVIRMGAVVKAPLKSNHPKVIDYATNGMRSDFMDIYLGAKCAFCISVGTGFDAVPQIFRRPIAYVNMVPIGYLNTSQKNVMCLSKRYWLESEHRFLSLREIFDLGVAYCTRSSDYEARGVRLVENTPQEIRSLVLEMSDRLKGIWQPQARDDDLQGRFWQIYPIDAREYDMPLHGRIHARYGAQFLRDNPEWLE